MKLSLKISFLLTLLISIIIYFFIDIKLPFLFVLELFYLILLALEKIILPLYNTNKIGINKKQYYREELSNYSPFINAIILNRNIFDADVIAAMFLYLEDKGYDGSKTYQNDKLLSHEIKFIQKQDFYLSYLKEKDYANKDLAHFKKIIINDMIKENILLKKNSILYIDKIDLISFLFIMIRIIFTPQFLDPENEYIIIELFYNIIWILIYVFSYIQNLSIVQILTTKGKEYYAKLLASRKFLKDFSVISSRNIEEKSLWNSYLYNAILFNLQGKLDDDAKQYYKVLLTKNNYYINKNFERYILIITSVILIFPWISLYFNGNLAFKIFLQNFINAALIIYLASKKL